MVPSTPTNLKAQNPWQQFFINFTSSIFIDKTLNKYVKYEVEINQLMISLISSDSLSIF